MDDELDMEVLEEGLDGHHGGDGSHDEREAPPFKKRKLESSLGASVGAVENPEEAEASLLELEVNELLAEAAVQPRLEAAVLELAKQVTHLLKSLPAVEVGKTAAKGFLKDLAFVVKKPFTFRPPASIQQVGSFVLRAATRPHPSLDLGMEMPAQCFDSKDQLNHRYHAKRALYLAHVAQALKGQPGVENVTLSTLCNDPRKPVVVVHPPAGASPSGLTIRLIPTAPPTIFPLGRLAPHRNNLRTATAAAAAAEGPKAAAAPAKAAASSSSGKTVEAEAGAGVPTPHYNTSVLQDLLLVGQHEVCRATAARAPNFAAAAALLRVWARAQAVDVGADSFGGFLLTMLLVDLIQKGSANPGMSAMHLFRTALLALASPRTFSRGLLMQRAAVGSGSAPPPEAKAWCRAFPVVFVDASGWLNLAAHVSQAALAQAQRCAKASLELLNASTPEAFEAVFLARRPLPSLCDYWYHVALAEEGEHHRDALSQDQPAWRSAEAQVEAVVRQALGSRAKWVRVFRREAATRSSLKAGAPYPRRRHVLLGAQVDPTAALRAVDAGPPADQADAAPAFREFWGDRSELRRFQDGSICEAVVWECGPAERHLTPDRVVSYALQRHLPPGTVVTGFAGALDQALRRSRRVSPDYDMQVGRLCEAATDRLSKQLRGLTGVTLRVVSTQPLSAVLRHTAVFPPLPHLLAGAPHSALPPQASPRTPSVPRCLEPVEVVCQLEGSGKWPENVAAFLKMKAALGVQLAQALQASYGLEAQAAEGGYVDVTAEGFAFRLLLATERDAAMQQKALAMAQQTRVHPSLDLPLRAWHQGAVSGVAGTNPAFEPTTRLAQRWVAAHLLSPHLCPEAVELLVAHCFAVGAGGPGAAAPGSRTLGMLRFLRLLCDHPWRVSPLIVDPDREMTPQQHEALVRQHSIRRAAGTAPAMFISTPRDPGSTSWTHDHPSAPMLHRITVLAKRSADALERVLRGSQADPPAPPPAAAPPGKHKKPQQQQRRPAKGRDSAAAAVAAAAAAEAAMAQLFAREEGEYDVLVRLRHEALPNGDRGSLLPGHSRDAARSAFGEGHVTAPAPVKVEKAAVNKHSRAILSGIPQSVLQARGAQAVRRELLVGFDPVPMFVEALEQRYGFLAVFCADYVGGDVVGIKWRASAFVPGLLRPEHAHALCALEPPARKLASAKKGGGKGGKAAASVVANGSQAAAAHPAVVGDTVPDVAAILDDILAMGAGLVESVEVLRGPWPRGSSD